MVLWREHGAADGRWCERAWSLVGLGMAARVGAGAAAGGWALPGVLLSTGDIRWTVLGYGRSGMNQIWQPRANGEGN